MNDDCISDRVRGCIIAGAIGDAMGGPFEGQPGPLKYRDHSKWQISDDSQLTLASCDSIAQLGFVSPQHIAAQFLRWFRAHRITGVGASTLKALRDLDAGSHWALAGATGEMSAGNGAAMRIAPLAFHLDPEKTEHRQTIRDVCRITHHHEEAYVGALSVLSAIRFMAFNKSSEPEALFAHVIKFLPDSRVRDRVSSLSALPAGTRVAEVAGKFGSTGYVVDSVPLALFAACTMSSRSLDAMLRSVIEAGGDTDTIASMAAQISGARVGASQIPTRMIERLPDVGEIKRVVDDFARAVRPAAYPQPHI